MHRSLVLLAAAFAAFVVGVTAAWAGFPDMLDFDDPQLVYGDASAARAMTAATNTSEFGDPRVLVENVVIKAREGTVTTLTAPFEAVYVCVNGGGNAPNAANKTTLVGELSTSATFPAAKNGKSTGSLLTGPLPSAAAAAAATEFSCPGGQVLEFDRVIFSGLVLQVLGDEPVVVDATLVSQSVHGVS
jgi:hypothetical protein